jgi:DNA polymerase elongation subunit (family B)
MYPTIAIEYNISFEIVNCRCCKDNPNARIPSQVMDEINQRLQKKGLPNRIESYWICKQRNGAFPTKLKKLIREREHYQQLVNQELAKPKEQQQQEETSSKAYKLFSEGKSPVEVAIALNLREPEATKLFIEYCKLSDSIYSMPYSKRQMVN